MSRVTIPDAEQAATFVLDELASPSLTDALAGGIQATLSEDTRLSAREREVVRIRMAHAVGCESCLQWRPAGLDPDAPDEPLPDEFYEHVLDPGWSGYPLRERLAIAFAERFALDPGRLDRDDSLWRSLRERFDDGELADLALIAGAWLGTGRALAALRALDR